MRMLSILGLVFLVVYLVNWRKRPAQRRFRTWVAIAGGACFAGGVGLVPQALGRVSGWGASVSSSATGRLVGASVAWVAALVVVLLVAYDLGLDDRVARLRGRGGGIGRGGLAGRLSGGDAGAVNGVTPWLGWLVAASVWALSGLPPQLWAGTQQLVTRVTGG